MDDFGWNPGTLQAVGGAATALALVVVIIGSLAARRSAHAATQAMRLATTEAELRTRPWLHLEEVFPGGWARHLVTLRIKNVGALPARRVRIALDVTQKDGAESIPVVSHDVVAIAPSGWYDDHVAVALPAETPTFASVVITGEISYLGPAESPEHKTRFEIEMSLRSATMDFAVDDWTNTLID